MIELSEADERKMRGIISVLAKSEKREEWLKREEENLGDLLYSSKSNKKTMMVKTFISIVLIAYSVYSYYWCDLLEYLSQRAVISEVFCDGVG